MRLLTLLFGVMLPVFMAGAAAVTENLASPDAKWSFNEGGEFPGARGAFCFDAVNALASQPALRLDADFSGGGSYVAIDRKMAEPFTLEEFRFKIQSPATMMNLRFYDSAGQVYQKAYPLSGNPDEIQEIAVKRFGGAEGFASWGRGTAGEFVQPMVAYSFTVHKSDLAKVNRWTTRIGDIRLTGSTRVALAAGGTPARWHVAPGATLELPVSGEPTANQCKYLLYAYDAAKPMAAKAAEFADGKLSLQLPSAPGFYELTFPELGWTGGVIVAEEVSGAADPYFAIDAAFSIFQVYNDRAVFESAVRFLKRAGIHAVRDRLTWRTLEPEQGKFQWGLSAGNGETLREFCRAEGMDFLDVWHDAPGWTGAGTRNGETPVSPYPEDLLKTADSWRTVAGRWQGKHSMLEVWNEPEIGFGGQLPGDQVTALHKAVSYAFGAAGTDTLLCGGVFTGFFRAPELIRPYVANGLLDECDAFSFHDYQTPLQFEKMVGEFRGHLTGSGREGIAFLISECGKPWPRGADRAPAEADRISAAWIAAKAIEGKAVGLKRFYAFIYYFYDENQNNFGMMDRNFTPMRSMAAYANAARLLAGLEYAGDFPVTGVDRARVFVNGDRAVITLFLEKTGGHAVLPAGFRPEKVLGIDGRALPLPVGGTLAVSDRLVYLTAPKTEVARFLKTDTEAMRLTRLARDYRPQPRRALPLVYQFLPELETMPYNNDGYLLEQPKIRLSFYANNLGDRALTAQPRFGLPGGATLAGAPEKIELAPRSRVKFSVEVDFGTLPGPKEQVAVKLYDADGRGSAVVLPFRKWAVEFIDVPPAAADMAEVDPTAPAADGWRDFSAATNWRAWQSEQRVPDIGGAMRVFWSPSVLSIQVLVRDDRFSQPFRAAEAWKGDSVQIALQPLYNNRIPLAGQAEITAAMTADGPVVYRNLALKGGGEKVLVRSKLTFSATPGRQLYLIELDAAELELGELSAGRQLGMSFLVNSNNGEARRGYLEWGGGIGETKNPREFNQLVLKH